MTLLKKRVRGREPGRELHCSLLVECNQTATALIAHIAEKEGEGVAGTAGCVASLPIGSHPMIYLALQSCDSKSSVCCDEPNSNAGSAVLDNR